MDQKQLWIIVKMVDFQPSYLPTTKKNCLSMLRISPKLISVEGNRVEYVDEKDSRVGTDKGNGRNQDLNDIFIIKNNQAQMFKDGGRFPTQLFTNIKNDRYKYVKSISLDKW